MLHYAPVIIIPEDAKFVALLESFDISWRPAVSEAISNNLFGQQQFGFCGGRFDKANER